MNKAYETRILIKTGIFAYIRHPIYAAYGFIASFGLTLILNRIAGFFFMIIGFFALKFHVIPKEEKILVEEFGEEFIKYREEVGAFFPKLCGNKKKSKE